MCPTAPPPMNPLFQTKAYLEQGRPIVPLSFEPIEKKVPQSNAGVNFINVLRTRFFGQNFGFWV